MIVMLIQKMHEKNLGTSIWKILNLLQIQMNCHIEDKALNPAENKVQVRAY